MINEYEFYVLHVRLPTAKMALQIFNGWTGVDTMNTNQPTYDDILRLFQETNVLMRELFVSQKETDRKFQETSREIKAVNKAVNESIGRLGNRLGDFVEEMVRPAAVRLFREQSRMMRLLSSAHPMALPSLRRSIYWQSKKLRLP